MPEPGVSNRSHPQLSGATYGGSRESGVAPGKWKGKRKAKGKAK